MNDLTLFLHQLMGPIVLVGGISFLTNMKSYKDLMKRLDEWPLTVYLSGVIALSIGIAIILKHNLWGTVPEIIVSLFGWIAIIEGILIIIVPEFLVQFSKKISQTSIFTIAPPIAWLALGIYMCWIGYFA